MSPPAENAFKYRVFLSYSHTDNNSARWLHRALETYRVPRHLAGIADSRSDIPQRLSPVFRDRDELSSASDLTEEVNRALQDSESLVVICSPAAARSHWVNEEIIAFKKFGRVKRIFCFIVDGEPHSGGDQECFPEAVRFELSPEGEIGTIPAEPLAADARRQGDGRRNAKLRLIAGLLGVGFDDLRQRNLQRSHRRMVAVTAGSLLISAVTIWLAITAYLSSAEAERRRTQAEDLIGFMLGDLQEGLHEIGRLDIFMRVGNKAMEYFAALAGERDVSDGSLSQRAKALRLIGEARTDQGETGLALESFKESLIISQQLADRDKTNTAWQIALANSHYYIGALHFQRDELEEAKREFQTVLPIIDQLSDNEPDNTEWIAERGYANTNLARVLELQGQLEEALKIYQEVKIINDRLVELQPDDLEYQLEVGFAHNNIGKVVEMLGRLEEAETHYRSDLEIKLAVLAKNPGHNTWNSYLATSHRFMGRILSTRGQNQEAKEHYLEAIEILARLLAADVERTNLQRQMALSRLELGAILRIEGESALSEIELDAAIDVLRNLVSIDSNNASWQREYAMALLEQAELLRSRGEPQPASRIAGEAISTLDQLFIKEPNNLTTIEESFIAGLRMGDIQQDLEKQENASASWGQALEGVERYFPGSINPKITDLRSALLIRLGRGDEAAPLMDQLETIGYQSKYHRF